MVGQYQIHGSSAAEIIASIETGIRRGHLKPGELLPPVRRLAVSAGIAPATVGAAYRVLRQRGIIDTAGRRGTHIRHRLPLAHRPPAQIPTNLIDLTHGEPDPELLPDLTAALSTIPTNPAGYRDAGPSPALIDRARERFAADGLHGTITVTGGALDGIDRALSAHLSPGDTVAIEDPCWANVRDLTAALGLHTAPILVDAHGPIPDKLDGVLTRGARAAIITSRAHNPTGATITADRAAALRDIVAGHPGTLIIEDDHYGELSALPLRPVADAADTWLFLRSASKPYGPDLRIAIACGDEATVSRLEGRMRIGSGWVSTILQHLLLGLWEHPDTDAVVATAATTYRRRRATLRDALAVRGVAAADGPDGLNVWIPVSDETHTVTALRDAGYAVAAGAAYRGTSAPGIRVTTATLDEADAGTLADAIDHARNPQHALV